MKQPVLYTELVIFNQLLLSTGSKGGKTGTPVFVTSLSSSWCPSCSTGEWISTVCHNSWLACSCVCPTVVPRGPSLLSWRHPCCGPASGCTSHGAGVRTVAPSETATNVCASLRCLLSGWRGPWPHCCYWQQAPVPPHLHLKHTRLVYQIKTALQKN